MNAKENIGISENGRYVIICSNDFIADDDVETDTITKIKSNSCHDNYLKNSDYEYSSKSLYLYNKKNIKVIYGNIGLCDIHGDEDIEDKYEEYLSENKYKKGEV